VASSVSDLGSVFGAEVLAAVAMQSRASAGLLLYLILDPKNGGDIFFRNVVFSQSYTAIEPRRRDPDLNFVSEDA
jgi:hypothetical protein